MAGPVIAFTENIFPTLDPALGELKRLNHPHGQEPERG